MNLKLEPGELPITSCTPRDGNSTMRNFQHIRHNLLLRRQRNGGSGYLLDDEAEYILAARMIDVVS